MVFHSPALTVLSGRAIGDGMPPGIGGGPLGPPPPPPRGRRRRGRRGRRSDAQLAGSRRSQPLPRRLAALGIEGDAIQRALLAGDGHEDALRAAVRGRLGPHQQAGGAGAGAAERRHHGDVFVGLVREQPAAGGAGRGDDLAVLGAPGGAAHRTPAGEARSREGAVGGEVGGDAQIPDGVAGRGGRASRTRRAQVLQQGRRSVRVHAPSKTSSSATGLVRIYVRPARRRGSANHYLEGVLAASCQCTIGRPGTGARKNGMRSPFSEPM